MMTRRHFAPAVLLLATAAALVAQEAQAPKPQAAKPQAPPEAAETPTFPAQVEQVIVDTVVTDKKGGVIRDLAREDFTITEDGVPQAIASFEAVVLPEHPSTTPPPPPKVTLNTTPEERRGRTFVILFDDMNITPFRANQAKAAVASFLEKGTREGDRVTLVASAGGVWWSARMEVGAGRAARHGEAPRRPLDPRHVARAHDGLRGDADPRCYRDPQVVERVLRRYETYGVTQVMQQQPTPPGGRAPWRTPTSPGGPPRCYYLALTRNRTTLDALERALNGLSAAKGRKSVILVSEGFIYDVNLDEFKHVNQASRRANAAIYFLDARGLEGMPVAMTAQFGQALPDQDVGFAFAETIDAVAGADLVASDCGGFTVRNTNDLGKGIQRIADETQAYYLLGYNPQNAARDGKFRKIQVKLATGKGLQVRARKGYYAPREGEDRAPAEEGRRPRHPERPRLALGRGRHPPPHDRLRLRRDDPRQGRRPRGDRGGRPRPPLEEKEGRVFADVQFLLVVAHRESGEFFRYDQAVNMKLLPSTKERLNRQWFPIVRDFELKSGDYQAKIVVRDNSSGRIGTVIHEFEVPPLGELRVSTPVLSDTRAPAGRGGRPRRDPVRAGPPRVPLGRRPPLPVRGLRGQEGREDRHAPGDAGLRRQKPDGGVLTAMEPSPINPTSLGQVMRTFGFKLADVPPGDYEIVMAVRDYIAGRSFEISEPFKVVEPLPASALPPAAATPTATATPPGE